MPNSSLANRIDELRDAIVGQAVNEIFHSLPELAHHDPSSLQLVREVLDDLLTQTSAALRHRVPVTINMESPAAQKLERAMVRAAVPVTDLVMALQIVQRVMVQALLVEPNPQDIDFTELPQALGLVSGLGEQITRDAVARFEQATALWNQSSGAGIHRRVLRILDGSLADAATIERLLGYSMAGPHICLQIWSEDQDLSSASLVNAHRALRALPGVSAVLLVPVDEREFWAWATVPEPVAESAWRQIFAAGRLPVRVAVSSAAPGVTGFRSTHRDALAVAKVARSATEPRIVFHSDVAAICFLAQDPARALEYVHNTLGDLGADNETMKRLRETLRFYLRNGDDTAKTGQQFFIHRNTVAYRVGRAIELLPRPLQQSRIDVMLALEYAAWFPIARA